MTFASFSIEEKAIRAWFYELLLRNGFVIALAVCLAFWTWVATSLYYAL